MTACVPHELESLPVSHRPRRNWSFLLVFILSIFGATAAEDLALRPVIQQSGLYDADYIHDFHMGDDPFRYTNW